MAAAWRYENSQTWPPLRWQNGKFLQTSLRRLAFLTERKTLSSLLRSVEGTVQGSWGEYFCSKCALLRCFFCRASRVNLTEIRWSWSKVIHGSLFHARIIQLKTINVCRLNSAVYQQLVLFSSSPMVTETINKMSFSRYQKESAQNSVSLEVSRWKYFSGVALHIKDHEL